MTGFMTVEIWTLKFKSCIFLLVPTIETLTKLESHIGEKSLALQKHIKARVPKMAFSSHMKKRFLFLCQMAKVVEAISCCGKKHFKKACFKKGMIFLQKLWLHPKMHFPKFDFNIS